MGSNLGKDLFFESSITYSLASGFYEQDTSLILSSDDTDALIRWTADGSTPSSTSSVYSSPIRLEETVLIRAASFKPDFAPSGFSDNFYLINQQHELPIVQISIEPTLLFEDFQGMYVSGTNGIKRCSVYPHNWNQNWERSSSVRLFDEKGVPAFKVNSGVKIGGGCSRYISMKGFNLFLREESYGDAAINYQLFPNSKIDQFKRFKLRSGGNEFSQTRIRDGVIQSILYNQLDIDLMAYQPVVLYLNGEYWGFYGMREMYNKHYIADHHQVDSDNIDLIKIPHSHDREVKEGDDIAWDSLVGFIKNSDFNNATSYEEVEQKIDINEFINYHISELFVANYDWPVNNMMVWRDRNNGKWRWMLYDTDWSSNFGNEINTDPFFNSITHATVPTMSDWPNNELSTLFLRKFLKNPNFRNEFAQRSCTIAQLIFAPDRTNHFIDSLQAMVAPEVIPTQEKFNNAPSNWTTSDSNPAGGTLEEWNLLIQEFKIFFEQRLDPFLTQYQEYFDFKGRFDLQFNFDSNSNGQIALHDNEMKIPFNYSGQYFQDIPIRISALPNEGYYFVRWIETQDTSSVLSFSSNKDEKLTPLFLKIGTKEQPLGKAPFLQAFPIPTNNLLNLRYSDINNDQFTVRIYNALGQLFYEENFSFNIHIQESSINIGNWSKGVYFLKTVISEKEEIYKIILTN